MTEPNVKRIDSGEPAQALIDQAVRVLEDGGLVVAPTETRYGLLARADQAGPLQKVYRLKKRSTELPTAVFVGSIELMIHYANLNPIAQRLARLFLPGPLTLVLPAIGTYPDVVVTEDRIGLRVSSSPVIQKIIQCVGFPVSATSANISGEVTSGRCEEIAEIFGDEINLYLDAGRLAGQTSTVVDCCGPEPVVLRTGAISAADIEVAVKGVTK
ncbi:MAG: threonylcarbamoyl-AMP synthase [candidate division Zixibacteria bacterium]|nr:threonylcarbamoyl-AMP synthase [candidate division Zixibacteria bacterium]